MTSRAATLGIDIGATKTLVALFDENLALLDEVKIKTDAASGEKSFVARLSQSIQALLDIARGKKRDVRGVVAGIPGEVDIDGRRIIACPNIPFLPDCDLHARLRKVARIPIAFGNDCHLALYGEHCVGAAVGCESVIGVFLGSGVGGALIIGGHLHRGATGAAGDIGHYLLQPIEPLAGSDQLGFLDDFASRTALSSEAARLAAKQWAPYLQKEVGTDVRNIRSNQLAQAIRHGDKPVEDLVRGRMRTVGMVLSNFVDFLNPELVLLGGGLVEAVPRLVRDEVKAGIKQHTSPRSRKAVRVVVSKLKRHAVTTGAAKIAQALAAQEARSRRARR